MMIANYRCEDVMNLPKDKQEVLQQYAPNASSLPKRLWFSVMTCIAVEGLIKYLSPVNYAGASQGDPIRAFAALAGELQSRLGAPSLSISADQGLGDDSLKVRQWLHDTRELLSSNTPDALSRAEGRLTNHIAEEIVSAICAATRRSLAPSAIGDLLEIVESAQDLYRRLLCQESKYIIRQPFACAPPSLGRFYPGTMETLDGTMDDIESEGKPIEISVFPMLFKISASTTPSVSPVLLISSIKVY
jgi:hypothetical protein